MNERLLLATLCTLLLQSGYRESSKLVFINWNIEGRLLSAVGIFWQLDIFKVPQPPIIPSDLT